MTADVMERLTALRVRVPTLRLYALVDGAQYQQKRSAPMPRLHGTAALFDGTVDAPLAHAGPWLVDAEQADAALVSDLARIEREVPGVTWLIAEADLTGLTQLLQLKLDARLPDGRTALLRFWDPRVLIGLVKVLDASQRETFFAHIHEWHLLHNGKRAHIGRAHADV